MNFRELILLVGFSSLIGFINGTMQVHPNFDDNNIIPKTPVVVPVTQLIEARSARLTHNYMSAYPPWVNLTLLAIGQKFMRDNVVGFTYGTAMATGILVNPDITRIQIDVGNGANPPKVGKRYLSDAIHLKYWSTVDLVKDQDSLFETLNLVHAMHEKVGHNAHERRGKYKQRLIPEPANGSNPYNVNLKAWAALQADLRSSPLKIYEFNRNHLAYDSGFENQASYYPMNQFTFTNMLWTFVFPPVVVPTGLGIYDATEEQLMGFLHLFAFIGHSVGVQDKYNVAMQPNLEAAKAYLSDMLKIYILPSLFHSDYQTKVVAEAAVLAIREILPVPIDIGLPLLRICEDLLHIDCPNVRSTLSYHVKAQNIFFGPVFHTLHHTKSVKSSIRFIVNGLLQTSTLRSFKFNTLIYNNYTAGIIALDEEHLRRPTSFYTNE